MIIEECSILPELGQARQVEESPAQQCGRRSASGDGEGALLSPAARAKKINRITNQCPDVRQAAGPLYRSEDAETRIGRSEAEEQGREDPGEEAHARTECTAICMQLKVRKSAPSDLPTSPRFPDVLRW